MKIQSVLFSSALVLAGALSAGSVLAKSPYASWQSSDDDVQIEDSFNRSRTDTDVDVDVRKSEDNSKRYAYERTSDDDTHWSQDISKSFTSSYDSSDDDTTITKSSDDDTTITKYSDDDITKSWEDNDWTNTESTDLDFDLQVATPTLTSTKHQDQDAGHEAEANVLGVASGHSVGVEGGTNLVSGGNEETVYYGPALVNTNTNQLPQNNLFIQGSNGAPISQANTFAGRDMGPKGVFGDIGNTSAMVGGDVSNSSGAGIDQSGDSANGIDETMSSVVR